MIQTTRSRLVIRQDPDRASTVAGVLLACVGGIEAALAAAAIASEWAAPAGRGYALPLVRLLTSGLFAASGWLFLRGRSRVVLDLDHRMVVRYIGVGGRADGGNRSWDLGEFAAVVLVRRERRRLLRGPSTRAEIVCLRRRDGSDLELHWSVNGGAEIAARVADFTGLPLFGAR